MSLLSQLVYNFPIINVFSGSEADNPYYSLCIPKLFIQTNVTRKGLKQFINRQRLALGHDTPLKNGLLILDDCFESPQALDNDIFRAVLIADAKDRSDVDEDIVRDFASDHIGIEIPALYKQGRHLRASVWCVQRPMHCLYNKIVSNDDDSNTSST